MGEWEKMIRRGRRADRTVWTHCVGNRRGYSVATGEAAAESQRVVTRTSSSSSKFQTKGTGLEGDWRAGGGGRKQGREVTESHCGLKVWEGEEATHSEIDYVFPSFQCQMWLKISVSSQDELRCSYDRIEKVRLVVITPIPKIWLEDQTVIVPYKYLHAGSGCGSKQPRVQVDAAKAKAKHSQKKHQIDYFLHPAVNENSTVEVLQDMPTLRSGWEMLRYEEITAKKCPEYRMEDGGMLAAEKSVAHVDCFYSQRVMHSESEVANESTSYSTIDGDCNVKKHTKDPYCFSQFQKP
ncbi:hypothetical protein K438DRAFT_2073837 [Mycena galopus ATCC 62051]|nr:hypothetical protein K438DRAFT_2073837 [Mycena galopus ATCC 62051]